MPWNLLILPLLGGFLFLKYCHYFRIKLQRFDSYRLIFESAVVGTCLLIIARVFMFGLHCIPQLSSLFVSLRSVAPFPFLGTTLLAFALGPLMAQLINARVDEMKAKQLAVAQTSDEVLVLLLSSIVAKSAVMLTMDTGSVYVGYILELPNLERETKSIILLPMLSGYRDKETLATKLTNNYAKMYRAAVDEAEASRRRNHFRVVLPFSGIKSARLYDLALDPGSFSMRQSKRNRRSA